MPFVTKNGGLTITHDVVREKYDGTKIIQEANGLLPLRLGYGDACDYNPNSKEFKEIVQRGTPNPKERHWVNGENPVWRIPTNRMSHEDLLRLLRFFEMNKNQPDRLIHYEPSMEDIEIKTYGSRAGYHFPLWLLDELIIMKEFENGLRESIVDDPHTKKLTEEDLKNMLEALKARKEEEKDREMGLDEENVIRSRQYERGDKARAEGRRQQAIDKKKAREEADFEARKEEASKLAEEKLEKDGVLS